MNPQLFKTARPLARLRQGRTDWFRLDNKADQGVTDLWIYDEIGYFGVTAQDLVRELQDVTSPRINLHVSSPGGDVFDGLAIYNALRDHKATVTTHIDSLAASIASVIALAGDSVSIAKTATMMIHDGHGLAVGNAADMRQLADLLDKTSDTIAGVYADRAGGTVESWRGLMRAETWYDAEEAVAAGLATDIKGQASKQENSWDLTIYSHAGRSQAPAPPARLPAVPNVAANATPQPEPELEQLVFDADLFRSAMQEVYR